MRIADISLVFFSFPVSTFVVTSISVPFLVTSPSHSLNLGEGLLAFIVTQNNLNLGIKRMLTLEIHIPYYNILLSSLLPSPSSTLSMSYSCLVP